MKVWVVDGGWHSNRQLVGIYSSLEAAQRAHPGDWKPDAYGWSNGLTWDDARDITEHEVDD